MHHSHLRFLSTGSQPSSDGLVDGATVSSSRPLHEKFETLVDYLVHSHRNAWGGKNERECAAKMLKLCPTQGGELI